MTIYPYDSTIRAPFTQLLIDYFQELDSDIPEHIIQGKLTDLIQTQSDRGILHIALISEEKMLIGFSIYQVDTPASDWCKRPGWGFIREFYIIPSHRKKEYGTLLALHTEKALQNLGATQLYLTATDAIPFWLKCGWRQTSNLCSNGSYILEK